MQKKKSIEIYKSQKSYTKSLHQGFHLRDLLKLDLQCTEKNKYYRNNILPLFFTDLNGTNQAFHLWDLKVRTALLRINNFIRNE